jgi:hypothetical protein
MSDLNTKVKIARTKTQLSDSSKIIQADNQHAMNSEGFGKLKRIKGKLNK